MMYAASFDLRKLLPGAIELTRDGVYPSITLNLNTLTAVNAYLTQTSVFNFIVRGADADLRGFDYERSDLLAAMSVSNFHNTVGVALRSLAADAGWPNPTNISCAFDVTTRLVTFTYTSELLTGITFGSFMAYRLFGFAGDWTGSADTAAGTDLPWSVIVPLLDGQSMLTPVYESDPVAKSAFSATGRTYGIARTGTVRRRSWVQQYETLARTFRKWAPSAPDEFTYQGLFESCRAGLPFGVVTPDGDVEAYSFDDGADAFHPKAATIGNADQFHIPFNVIALATDAAGGAS